MSPVPVGAAAPDFALAAGPGPDRVRLSDHRGKTVVVMFVPLAFSGTCTEEFCHMRDNWAAWGSLDATVLGISIDSPFVVKKWAEDLGVQFPILSDFNREAAKAYDVLYEDFYGMKGVAKRSVFVVDPAGNIAYAWSSEDASVLPPFDAIRDAVVELSSG